MVVTGDQPDGGVQGAQVCGVGGDDRLVAAAGADHYVGVGSVGGSAGCQQPADVRGVHSAEVDHIGGGLADQPRQPGLPVGPADGLGERGRRNGEAGS